MGQLGSWKGKTLRSTSTPKMVSEHHEFGLTCRTHGGKVATSIGGVWHRGNTCGMETVLTHRVCGNSLCGRDGKKWQLCDREWSWQRFDLFWKWVGSLNLDTFGVDSFGRLQSLWHRGQG